MCVPLTEDIAERISASLSLLLYCLLLFCRVNARQQTHFASACFALASVREISGYGPMTSVFPFLRTGNAYATPFSRTAEQTEKALLSLRGDMISPQVWLRRFALP
jgi:3-deoxy-D-arabino-heptulosonate 7-phosphate (DAHP) synthase class II